MGELEQTVIIFTSDHGETAGSHGGLTDKGWQHFEEIQRVPMIIRFPDGLGAGQTREGLISLADVYPTILDLAGIANSSANGQGQSLLPLIKDLNATWRDHVVVEFGGVNNLAATLRTVIKDNHKYGYSAGFPDQLYDLASDPHEMTNLAESPVHRDRLNNLRQTLSDWMKKNGDPIRGIYNQGLQYNLRS
jgi:arylsulfatase A-like enzyme